MKKNSNRSHFKQEQERAYFAQVSGQSARVKKAAKDEQRRRFQAIQEAAKGKLAPLFHRRVSA